MSWPALIAAGSDDRRGIEPIYFAAAAFASALAAWITVSRMVAVPERRQMTRPNTAVALSHLGAGLFFIAGPLALVLAWWAGFEPGWRGSIGALVPAAFGGLGAVVARGQRGAFVRSMLDRAGTVAPVMAGRLFRIVIRLERAALSVLGKLISGVTSPLHDLHTGDAQEYLLFLVGIGVLALVIPLLQ